MTWQWESQTRRFETRGILSTPEAVAGPEIVMIAPGKHVTLLQILYFTFVVILVASVTTS